MRACVCVCVCVCVCARARARALARVFCLLANLLSYLLTSDRAAKWLRRWTVVKHEWLSEDSLFLQLLLSPAMLAALSLFSYIISTPFNGTSKTYNRFACSHMVVVVSIIIAVVIVIIIVIIIIILRMKKTHYYCTPTLEHYGHREDLSAHWSVGKIAWFPRVFDPWPCVPVKISDLPRIVQADMSSLVPEDSRWAGEDTKGCRCVIGSIITAAWIRCFSI